MLIELILLRDIICSVVTSLYKVKDVNDVNSIPLPPLFGLFRTILHFNVSTDFAELRLMH